MSIIQQNLLRLKSVGRRRLCCRLQPL